MSGRRAEILTELHHMGLTDVHAFTKAVIQANHLPLANLRLVEKVKHFWYQRNCEEDVMKMCENAVKYYTEHGKLLQMAIDGSY